MNRYSNIYLEIAACEPESIMEIGTWNGDNAVKMIKKAQKFTSKILYIGFDLFEKITDEEIIKEHSKSVKANMRAVDAKLRVTKADITLIPGYTKDTIAGLPATPIDFIFVDGGHSVETIKTDWKNIQKFIHKGTVILFDDYYKNRNDLGCKFLIDELERDKNWFVEHLTPEDVFDKGTWKQYTRIIKVWPRCHPE